MAGHFFAQETTQWYSSLLQSGKVPELSLATKLFRLQANMAPRLAYAVWCWCTGLNENS